MRHTIKRQLDDIASDVELLRQRAGFAGVTMSGPPEEVAVSPVDAAGVPCEWISHAGGSDDMVLLYLHGGGYVFGGLGSHRNVAWRLVRAGGFRVLLADYRLAPEHPFPAALEDATLCYRWLLDQGFSQSSIGIGGDCAGGGLGVATMVNLRNLGLPLPAAAIAMSPWADLSGSGESVVRNSSLDPMLSPVALENMARLYLGERDRKAPLASPVFADLKGLPPLLVHAGSTEIVLSDAERLVHNYLDAQGDATLKTWDKMPHAFQIFAGRIPEADLAIEELAAFLNSQFLAEEN
jgi:epsilon-lactone hydrolase